MTQLDPFQSEPATKALARALDNPAGDKRLEVLRRVALGDSISQAAREVGISYKAAWQAIDTLTNLSGVALVERTVGGAGGGGARITEAGVQLLALADALAQARAQILGKMGVGALGVAGLGLRTSMRNQLPCRVVRCAVATSSDPMMVVTLQRPSGDELVSCITHESADLLGLVPGLDVLVMCKATAVEVLAGAASHAASTGAAGVQCSLRGKVQRLARGAKRDEVTLALPGGGFWVGFAGHPFAGRVGSNASARMAASALVIGLAG